MNKKYQFIIFFIITTICVCCSGGEMVQEKIKYKSIEEVSNIAWQELAEKKIYFGHQSIGFNIIDGLKDIMKENPQIKFKFIESPAASKLKEGNFLHSRVGANSDPAIKINDFFNNIDNGLGNKVDFAFLKFCYFDVVDKTDVKKVFENYSNNMDELIKKYPKTNFIHFTVPLTISKSNWKTWLKKTIGKGEMWEYNANIKRNDFNNLLVEKYGSNVFDLAKIESTDNMNRRVSFTYKSKTYYSMCPEYTNDGGHFNEIGRKKIAEQLLIHLVNMR